ncbi:MAG: pyridoxine 5'-phosphate synthase [Candidatus Muiribacteriota bacterium]
MLLGVNIDHIATLRNARGENNPSLEAGALICELSGADGITVHLREDRRHIKDRDLYSLKNILKIPVNLEMALNEQILDHALKVKPRLCTLVPEKREEVTTEGGLDIKKFFDKTKNIKSTLEKNNIKTSLFIEAEFNFEKELKEISPEFVEIHTGHYSQIFYDEKKRKEEVEKIKKFAQLLNRLGIRVSAGHGLNYNNVQDIAAIEYIEELNIGHAIISKSVFSGLENAVREMKDLIKI